MRSPLLILAILLVALLIGGVAAPFFIDWSSYRAEIEDYGRRLMGRDVRIAGDIDIRFLPLPALHLEDVRVANADTAASPVFLAVKKFEGALLLAPLLRGEVRIHSVELEKPVIDIERLASGKGNWHLEPTQAVRQAVPIKDFGLEQIRVNNGTIYIRDHRRGGKAKFDNVNLEISAVSLEGPYQARGGLSYEKEPVTVSVSTGKYQKDGALRLRVGLRPETGARLLYAFDGQITGEGSENLVEGKIKIAPPPIQENEKSRQLTGLEKLPFLFRAEVEFSEERLALKKIDLALDSSNAVTNAVSGSAELQLGYEIGIDAELSARRVDLDALARDLGGQIASQLRSAVSFDTMDAIAGLLPEGMRGRVRLKAGQLKTGAAVIESGKLDIQVTDTGVRVAELSGLLPGRTNMKVTGLYLPDRVTPQFNGRVEINALDGRGFLNWVRPGLYGEESGRIGRLKLAGELSATPENARVEKGTFAFDGGEGKGSVFWSRSGTPFIAVKLEAGELDLSTLLPAGREAGLLDVPGLVDKLNTGEAPVSLDVKAGKLAFGRRSLGKFVADVKFSKNNADVRRLSASIGEGGQIDLAGEIVGTGKKLRGEMSGKVNSPDAVGLLGVLGANNLSPQLEKLLAAEPLDLWVEYSADHEKSRLSLEGLAGGGLTGTVLEVKGPLTQWRKAEINLNAEFETNRAGRLVSALDLGSGGVLPRGKANAKVSFKAGGELAKGWNTSLSGRFLGVQYEIAGTYTDSGTGHSLEGSIDLKSPDVTDAAQALAAGVTLKGPLSVKAKVEGNASRYRISDAQLSVSGLKGSFSGAFGPREGVNHIAGNAVFEQLDFGRALGLLALGPPERGLADGGLWAKRPFRREALKSFSADVKVSAKLLALAPTARVSDATFLLKAGENGLSITAANGEIYGGTVSGDLAMRNEGAGNVDVIANIEGRNLDLTSVIRNAKKAPFAKGRLSVSGKVSGRGRSPGGVISVLAGQGEWSLEDAVLDGTNPEAFQSSLRDVAEPSALEKKISENLESGSWPFGTAQSKWSAESGLLRMLPAPLSTPAATGSLGALSNLASGEVDATWTVKIAGFSDVPSYSVALKGPLAAVKRSHDTSGLRSFMVVKVLQEGMQKLEALQDEQEKLFQERKRARGDSEQPAPGKEPAGADSAAGQPEKPDNGAGNDADRAAEEAARKEAKRLAAEEEARKAAEQRAAEEAARKAADQRAAEEAARKAADQRAAEEAARKVAEQQAAEEVARKAADQRTAEEAVRKAADQRTAEEAVRKAADQRAAEEAARKAADQRAAEEAARKAADQRAAEEAARKAADQRAAEEAARKAADQRAAEEAARKAAAQRAADEAARKEAERLAAQKASREEAAQRKAEEVRKKAAEEAAKRKAEAAELARKQAQERDARKREEDAAAAEAEQRQRQNSTRKTQKKRRIRDDNR